MPKKKKEKKVERREVQRQHIWTPGHDPNDPDAYPESGWQYIKISGNTPAETRDFRNALKLGGGPESGMPCMHCGEMTRIVDEVTALDVLEQAFVLNGEQSKFDFTEAQKERFRNEKLAILMCPKCEAVTQFRLDAAKTMRQRWLDKQNAA